MGVWFRWIRALYECSVSSLGKRVDRATAGYITGVSDIFRISGGNVLVTSLIGEVTTVIPAGANDMQFRANPTIGAEVVLDAVLDIDGHAEGMLYTITGNPADAIISGLSIPGGLAGGLLATGINTHGWAIPPGTIDASFAHANGTGTGRIKFQLYFIPLDRGAVVQVA